MIKAYDFVSWHTQLVSGNFDPQPLIDLGTQDFVVFDNCIQEPEAIRILNYIQQQQENFKLAAVGNRLEEQKVIEIRNDSIQWIERTELFSELQAFFEFIDQLIEIMNRFAYLSIKDSEFHMTHYGPGRFYKRHLDQFQASSNRVLSVIFYLNPNWQEADGGQLQLFKEEGGLLVEPILNRVVVMRSDKVEHEVKVNYSDRYSITGWLLNQPKSLPFI